MTLGNGAVVFLAVILVAACDGSQFGSKRPGFEMRDSAGVALTINSQPERSLSLVEEFSIGVVDGDPNYLFDRVRAIAIDENEGTWVVDSHESVRHYDRTGQYAGAVGGRGEGPGEARG